MDSYHGYAVIDVKLIEQPPLITDDLKPFWGGYNIAFKLVESALVDRCGDDRESLRRSALVVGSTGSTVFRVDISKHEYVAEKQSYVVDGIEFFGYSVEMAVAEKLRAICQQMPAYRQQVHKHLAARARDFVDIHVLIEEFRINFSNPDFQATLTKVFAAKRVPLQLLGQISQHRDDHRPDFVAVAATIRPDITLEDYDFYVDRVVRECEQLKPLWDKQTPA